ncbi:uncharacterized protein LOC121387644 [Gigantopelta aegis]|uniref:uncharacterized protein LOC121387644 n=1 Tax=Gigantopelta aegis TaxID=1735272 RepID=UPI001B88D439|nr:uncharacterized protein LOC121387644 [Gigantopelta aegis]
MGFGLYNAPATFARAMNLVLRGLTWNVALAFLDDSLVMGKDQRDHLTNLRSVFDRFREYGLKFKPKKCELFQTKVEFLGRVIGPNGVEMGTGYVDSVREWPIPRCTREVESFLGFAIYHRNFIANFVEIAVALYEITGKKAFMWGPTQEAAWVKLKEALVSTPVLTLPNKDDPFILDTDASDKAIGAELFQLQNDTERTAAYASCSLTSEQKKYCTTRKELLAVVKFTRQFRHYLLGRRFLVVPSEAELLLGDRESTCYWINQDTFHLDERGVPYKRIEDDSGSRELLVVPHSLRREWLRVNHDIPASGHQGMERTKCRMRARYYCYGMTRAVKNFVFTCVQSNRCKKGNRKARCPMKQFHAGVPMERVHLDFLGPLPKTENGNEYVLMVVDQFIKWVECIPLASQTAEVTARAAINEFFSRFSYPFEIFTDQGRHFESELFQEVCKLLHIHKARTTPYRPSANGQVKRYNRTLMDAIRCYINKSQIQWDDNLAQLAGALRSVVNRHSGYTPNHLMLGKEVNQPADLMFRPPDGAHVDEYVAQLEESIRGAHEYSRDKLGESHKE